MSPINKHIHLSEEELKQYIYAEHELSRIDIEHIELELQLCDICSNTYINLLDNVQIHYEPTLTEQLYLQVVRKAEQEESRLITLPIKKKWYEYSVVHYAAAASITGVLFVSGFFSVMTNMMNTPSQEAAYKSSNEAWFNLSEQQWVIKFQKSMEKIQIELFKEESK